MLYWGSPFSYQAVEHSEQSWKYTTTTQEGLKSQSNYRWQHSYQCWLRTPIMILFSIYQHRLCCPLGTNSYTIGNWYSTIPGLNQHRCIKAKAHETLWWAFDEGDKYVHYWCVKGQMHHHDDLGSKCAYTCRLSNKTTSKSVLLSSPQIWLITSSHWYLSTNQKQDWQSLPKHHFW